MKNIPPGFKILSGLTLVVLGVFVTAISESYSSPILLAALTATLFGAILAGWGIGEYTDND